ncbi:chorismate-binding protein, partial [Pseudomonas aeruginosa]|nr:chorismate-binding protein [Pseudomonas aeruginosa]
SAGEMDKVVLARATDLQFAAPLDAVSIMAASRRSNLNCFHFLMAFNARQAFFGSTPERLWRRRGALLRQAEVEVFVKPEIKHHLQPIAVAEIMTVIFYRDVHFTQEYRIGIEALYNLPEMGQPRR